MRDLMAVVSLVIVTTLSASAYAGPDPDRISQGDLTVAAGERVGDAVSLGGTLTVNGWITGDAVALGGGVHLLPGARVDGDITAVGGSIVVEPGAVAFGEQTGLEPGAGPMPPIPPVPPIPAPVVTPAPLQPDGAGPSSFVDRWLDDLSSSVHRLGERVGHMLALYGMLVVLGLIMLGVAPLRTRALAAAVAAQPGRSLGFGLLVILGTVVAIIVLSITVIGIPIAAVLAVAAACAAALGLTGVSILLGELLPVPSLKDRQVLKLMLGAAVLVVALAIPYAGGLLGVVATVLGLGSLAITRLRPGHAVFCAHGKGPYRSSAL